MRRADIIQGAVIAAVVKYAAVYAVAAALDV